MRNLGRSDGRSVRPQTLEELQKQRDTELEGLTFLRGQDARAFQPTQALPASRRMFDTAASADWDVPKMFEQPFPQTTSRSCLSEISPLTDGGKIVVKNVSKHIGKLTLNDETLGTAVLLSKDYALVPRHCVEGRLIDKMVLALGKYNVKCDYVVEEDAELDYAVIRISGIPAASVLGFASGIPESTLLFHYPLDGELVVSGHVKTIQNTTLARVDSLVGVRHDSDSGSSGGAYIDSSGKLVAIHEGVDISEDGSSMSASMGTGSAERYILSINDILNKHKNSILVNLTNSTYQPQLQSKLLSFVDEKSS